MSAFDKVIGYQSIKEELLQICDLIRNPDAYRQLGAEIPHGVILYGAPGMGKSLMAECLIEQCGLPVNRIRKDTGAKSFVKRIQDSFQSAKEQRPSIILLDDLDKFANEDERHSDAEEYVAIQAGIDAVKGSGVLVIATVNNMRKLPHSLIRSGRFDRKIRLETPGEKDSADIILHYLDQRAIDPALDQEDLTHMLNYSTCAELETIVNEAAVYAGYARKSQIEMEDLLKAVLRMQYDAPDSLTETSVHQNRMIALHEAGHLVISEVLMPGSIGLASLRASGRNSPNGFVRRCKEYSCPEDYVLMLLGGKAAAELYGRGTYASGCESDIRRASEQIRDLISESGAAGFGMVDVANQQFPETSESMNARNEAVVHAELNRSLGRARAILIENRTFLESTAQLLLEKETLLYSDIRKLRETCYPSKQIG